jgi:hypothetical protein
MNRKEAAELSPIIKAFSEGRPIQYRIKDNKSAKWNDVDKNYHKFSPHSFMYRIKPEPKYRPFKDEKECWTEMQKHQPVGWVKQINGKGIEVCIHCGVIKGDWILTAVDEVSFPFDGMYNNYTFVDGTPFGIKEEE